MDSLKSIISDIRVFVYGGIQKLPLVIAGTLLLIGLFTANYAMMFFLIGFLIFTPLAANVLDYVLASPLASFFPNALRARSSDICKINVPFLTLNSQATNQDTYIIFSTWSAMVVFFIGYLFKNALELYSREGVEPSFEVNSSEKIDIERKTANRKTQAIISMVSILLFGLIIMGFRYYTGCESVLGMGLTCITFFMLGYSWYLLLSSVGEDRLSDLFGIANRLLPPAAIQNKPIACIPTPNE
jgi:hypothetical protein